MRIYEISADCLVDFCMLHWYVKARNEIEVYNNRIGENEIFKINLECKYYANITVQSLIK